MRSEPILINQHAGAHIDPDDPVYIVLLIDAVVVIHPLFVLQQLVIFHVLDAVFVPDGQAAEFRIIRLQQVLVIDQLGSVFQDAGGGV